MTSSNKEENTAMFGDIEDIDLVEFNHQCVCGNRYPCACKSHQLKQEAEQQEDMADFIALNGQMDNEALTDWDDCSSG